MKSLLLENTQGSLQARMPGLVPTVKHGGDSVMVWVAILVRYFVGPIITLYGQITGREYVDRPGNHVHLTILQMLFPNNNAVFQDGNAPVGCRFW
jgi:hypothetical protein